MSSNRILHVGLGIIETFLFTGIIFGWPNLQKMFISEGFRNCSSVKYLNKEECSQSRWLTTIFTMASTTYCGTSVLGGWYYFMW